MLVIVLLISWLRLTPFLAILLGALTFSVCSGLPILPAIGAFQTGAGKLLGDAGIIIALGSMLGGMIEHSGAAGRVVSMLLSPGGRPVPAALLPWLIAIAAMMIGLPLFFEVGLVIMLPVIVTISKQSGLPLLSVAIPALAGMTALHALVPPHPGPLIAVSILHAQLGATLLTGLGIAIPAVILAGPLYGKWLSRQSGFNIPCPDLPGEAGAGGPAPSGAVSLAVLLLPVSLMLARTVSKVFLPQTGLTARVLDGVGEPFSALTLAVVFAVIMLGWARGVPRHEIGQTLQRSLPPVAVLLLTIGAGGGLKQVLLSAGIADTISKIAVASPFPPVVLVWLIAVCLRQATGSATVATSATAGLIAPLLPQLGLTPAQASLLALSIGSGSVFFCHVNDAGFWMVHELFRLSLKQTIMVWSVLQTIVSLTGLILCCVLWQLL
nr:gluconate:H+ symporter [Acetobacter musti]